MRDRLSRFAVRTITSATMSAVSGLGDVIAAQVAAWGGVDLPLERALFGTADPDGIAAAVDGWCRRAPRRRHRARTGSSTRRAAACTASSSTDGRARRGEGPPRRVDARVPARRSVRSSGDLADARSPGAPAAGRTGRSAVPATSPPRQLHPAVRARRRARPDVVRLLATRPVRLRSWPRQQHRDLLARRRRTRWRCRSARSTRHHTRYGSTSPPPPVGAEWIDELATHGTAPTRRRCRPATRRGPRRLAGQNLSVRDGRIDAVYDWDSVASSTSWTAVAVAALTFTVDWERARPAVSRHRRDLAFVDEYADARGGTASHSDETRSARGVDGRER